MAGRMTAEQRKWQAQDDLRTVKQAAEIQADKARASAVQKAASAEMKKLASVAGGTSRKGK